MEREPLRGRRRPGAGLAVEAGLHFLRLLRDAPRRRSQPALRRPLRADGRTTSPATTPMSSGSGAGRVGRVPDGRRLHADLVAEPGQRRAAHRRSPPPRPCRPPTADKVVARRQRLPRLVGRAAQPSPPRPGAGVEPDAGWSTPSRCRPTIPAGGSLLTRRRVPRRPPRLALVHAPRRNRRSATRRSRAADARRPHRDAEPGRLRAACPPAASGRSRTARSASARSPPAAPTSPVSCWPSSRSSYGNDWFVVPVDLPVGSVCSVERFVVTDTFGERTTVERSTDEGDAPWRIFELDAPAGPQRAAQLFFLAARPGRDRRVGAGRGGRPAYATRWPTSCGESSAPFQGGAGTAVDRYEEHQRRLAAARPAASTSTSATPSCSTGSPPTCPTTGSRSCPCAPPASPPPTGVIQLERRPLVRVLADGSSSGRAPRPRARRPTTRCASRRRR